MKLAATILLFFCVSLCHSLVNVGNSIPSTKTAPSSVKGLLPTLPPSTKTTYKNWATDRTVRNLQKLVATTPEDVAAFANAAYSKGMRLRALGQMHTWSPLTVLDDSDVPTVILVDTTTYLNKMEMSSQSNSSAVVKVQTGALMDDLLSFLEQKGYTMLATPAPGDITVGGVLAIDGHGTAIPAVGETPLEGFTYGSISNLVVSLTAVVWDSTTSNYTLKTFRREDPEAKAFLTNLGKTFLTEVELRVGPLFNLRCVSYMDIPSVELFADPAVADSSTRTFASFLDASGRVETILYPFTDNPWLKVWTISPEKPASSVAVSAPYNYPFSDNIPEAVSTLYSQIQLGLVNVAPLLGNTMYTITQAGLAATNTADIWGPAKNTLLYIKPSTLRVTANGYAVLTTRGNIQYVISTVFSKYNLLIEKFKQDGEYPANGPLEIRVTGLDKPEDVTISGAEAPSLSAIRPDDTNPNFDVAIWFDILSVPGTRMSGTFMTIFESYFLETFANKDGTSTMRPEWSKGWAYTNAGAWLNQTVLETIAQLHKTTNSNDGWDWAISTLNKYDRKSVFTNNFLSQFLV